MVYFGMKLTIPWRGGVNRDAARRLMRPEQLEITQIGASV